MEAKDSLSKIIEALIELETPVQKKYLIDFICGKNNEEIEEKDQTDLECFGILKGEDEALLLFVIEEAVKEDYLSFDADSHTYTYTAAGKKFLKKPKSFVIDYDEDEEDEEEANMDEIKDLIQEIDAEVPKKAQGGGTRKSSMKIQLIHAIDNQKALDDFAESQGQDFDVILDELESIVQSGMHINIDYFLEEVFTEDNIEELMDFYSENNGDLNAALQAFEDTYSPEELRLLRIKYLTMKKK